MAVNVRVYVNPGEVGFADSAMKATRIERQPVHEREVVPHLRVPAGRAIVVVTHCGGAGR